MTQQPRTPTTEAGRHDHREYHANPDAPDPCDRLTSILAIEADLLAQIEKERAKTADVLGARDILRDWVDGYDNGYPLPNGDWEGDVVERARAAIRSAAPVEP